MHNWCIEPIKRKGMHRGGAIDRALICLKKMIATPTSLLMMHLYPNRMAVGVKTLTQVRAPRQISATKAPPSQYDNCFADNGCGVRTTTTPGYPTCKGRPGCQLHTHSSISATSSLHAHQECPKWWSVAGVRSHARSSTTRVDRHGAAQRTRCQPGCH